MKMVELIDSFTIDIQKSLVLVSVCVSELQSESLIEGIIFLSM